jgi:hypothetical protein
LAQLRRPGPLSERLGSLRVGYVGRDARAWLGSHVQVVTIEPDWEPAAEAEHWIDVLVVDGDPSHSTDFDVRTVLAEARSEGIRTVGFVDGKSGGHIRDLVDITIGPSGGGGPATDLQLPPLVDLGVTSPVRSVPHVDEPSLMALRSRPKFSTRRSFRSFERLLDLETQRGSGAPWSLTLGDLGKIPDIAPFLDGLRSVSGVVDDESLHPSSAERASYLAQLATAGIPFRVLDQSPKALDSRIGVELRAAASGPVEDLFDVDERERISVHQRRIALKRFTDWGRWEEITDLLDLPMRSRPTVSIILATNRPEQLEHALRQIALQTYQPVEPILALHGDGFGDRATRLIAEHCPRARAVRVDGSLSLGDALNTGMDLATGELVTKMDDDDWYGTEHLWDLVHAMEYSNAELIGKAAEWVYLAEIDLTMRRFDSGAESGSATLAGGTMMMRRSDLLSVGGFRRARRHVDLGLIQDVKRLGGAAYRTHGFGYLLNRTAGGHTWDIGVDYFLEQSTTQIRGLSTEAPILPTDTVSAATPGSES